MREPCNMSPRDAMRSLLNMASNKEKTRSLTAEFGVKAKTSYVPPVPRLESFVYYCATN